MAGTQGFCETMPISPIAPQSVDYEACNKIFNVSSHKLFFLSLASANANRFSVDEIQSKSGYILFTVAQRQFLASVVGIDGTHSLLKITPCNNSYFFPVGIPLNFFKYIELNINTPIVSLSKT